METVRVELRKLQQLNDRINQTIDALTQLRQSVHGFQPASFAGGLQHTGAYANPYAQSAVGNPYAGIASGIGSPFAPAIGSPFAGVSAAGTPWFGQAAGIAASQAGLSHSSFGAEMSPWTRHVDPASAFRIAQSFPYAFAQMAPVVAL